MPTVIAADRMAFIIPRGAKRPGGFALVASTSFYSTMNAKGEATVTMLAATVALPISTSSSSATPVMLRLITALRRRSRRAFISRGIQRKRTLIREKIVIIHSGPEDQRLILGRVTTGLVLSAPLLPRFVQRQIQPPRLLGQVSHQIIHPDLRILIGGTGHKKISTKRNGEP